VKPEDIADLRERYNGCPSGDQFGDTVVLDLCDAYEAMVAKVEDLESQLEDAHYNAMGEDL
jgi:hypothetical protein